MWNMATLSQMVHQSNWHSVEEHMCNYSLFLPSFGGDIDAGNMSPI